MTPDELLKLQAAVADTIIKTVNGKIDKLNAKIDAQDVVIATHFEKVDIHMAGDEIWKKMYTKYIQGLVNVADGSKIISYIIITIAAVGAALLTIKTWFIK